jgi:predicted site-specific integrase-resolvase
MYKTPEQVGELFGVSAEVVISWVQAGLMPAVNVASVQSTRKRYRMTDADIEAFKQRRQEQPPQPKPSRRREKVPNLV